MNILTLTAKEERGEQLSPEEARLVDEYWAERAEPMSPEFRMRLIAAVNRALAERERRINEWRWLLFTIHWWWTGNEPEWHDYWDCSRCHPWSPVDWTGPYDLGRDDDGATA